jgi:hypothetical protein
VDAVKEESAVTLSVYSLVGAFFMLLLGMVDYALLARFAYPEMRRRHEEAKVTASHGYDPHVYMGLLKLVSFIVLPLAGFLFGDAVLRQVFG